MRLSHISFAGVCGAALFALTFTTGSVVPTGDGAMAFGGGAPAKPCAKFKWGSSKWKKCRKQNGLPTRSSADVEQAHVLGYALTKAGRHAEALDVLLPHANAADPRILTYIGFALRKQGDVQTALSYYHRAVALAPRNVATLEYMGEAYVQLNDLPAAREKLTRIAALCGTTCVEHRVLADMIAEAAAKNAPASPTRS